MTGTLLRGVAPAGAEILGVNNAQIQATGAITTNQLMETIPQVSNLFNNLDLTSETPTNQVQITRLNLRDLPGQNTASGSSTLILMDGHRITSAGITQFAPDADVIPPSIIDHVEIVPDGGSSTYGTDAVGGVVNFITKKHVDGLFLDARGGAADNYEQVNTDVLAGKDWGSGSAYFAWDFAENTTLLASARSYIKQINWLTGLPTGTQCNPPNVSANGVNYAYPGLAPNTNNYCDLAQTGTLYPRTRRESLFGGLTQNFGSHIKFELKGYYTEKQLHETQGPLRTSISVSPENPYYVNIPSEPGATQSVSTAFGSESASGESTHLQVWGVTPAVTVDLTHSWELRAFGNFGGSVSSYSLGAVDGTLANQYGAGTTTTTAIDPYDVAATQDQQLVQNISDFELGGRNRVQMNNVRGVFDGPLFALPAGPIKLAFGGEYLSNHLSSHNAGGGATPADFAAVPFFDDTQTVGSGFAELAIPVFGRDFTLPGIQELSFSASGRYDSYNDFGSTFNPKFGFTYKPIRWVTFRGSWGTSFNAPTPLDELNAKQDTLLVFPFPIIVDPYSPPTSSNEAFLALEGASPNLQPQKAIEKTVGVDVRWPFTSGLKSSVTFYNINYNQLLSTPPVFQPSIFFANFPNNYVINPTAAQVAAFVANVKNGAAQLATLPAGEKVYELNYYVLSNLGNAYTDGLDFTTSYQRPMSFGDVDITVNGTYEFHNQITNGPGLPPSNNLLADPDFRLTTILGADFGHLRAQVTWNHTAGYRDVYSATSFPQYNVGNFDIVNLFFRYSPAWQDWRKNTSFTLNVENLLDNDPPTYRELGGNGYSNGATLGRLFEVGIHKDF